MDTVSFIFSFFHFCVNADFIFHSTDVFEGVVHVYVPTSLCSWTLQSLIRSPSGANDNFGSAVAIDGLTIFTGANARGDLYFIFSFIFEQFNIKIYF